MKITELLEAVGYNERDKFVLGTVADHAKEYGLTPEIIASAMGKVRQSEEYKALIDLGLKELNVPLQRKRGTFNFKMFRRYSSKDTRPELLQPASYLIYANGQIRTAALTGKSRHDPKPDIGYGFTRLTTPKPQLSKDDPEGSLIKTYKASMVRLAKVWAKSKVAQEPRNLLAKELGVDAETLDRLEAGDEAAFDTLVKNLKRKADTTGVWAARSALNAVYHHGLKSPKLKTLYDYFAKADIAKQLNMKGSELDDVVAGDPKVVQLFIKRLLTTFKQDVGGHWGSHKRTEEIIQQARQLGINLPEFKTILKSIRATDLAKLDRDHED